MAVRRITCYRGTVAGNCGVGYISALEFGTADSWLATPLGQVRGGGCRWLLSGFINEPECEEAYSQLCKKHQLVFQSPVRRNSNSGRMFFFCIFDTTPRRRAA